MNDIKPLKFWDTYNKIVEEDEAKKQEWISQLKLIKGLKAAHPNDGWVDWERNVVHLAYPYFKDTIGQGDLIALGRYDNWCIVRVLKIQRSIFGMTYYYFEKIHN